LETAGIDIGGLAWGRLHEAHAPSVWRSVQGKDDVCSV
jgi:hypothetical protein